MIFPQIPIPPAITLKGQLNVTFPVEGREIGQGYLSPLNTESEFGIIVIQEWWGFNQAMCTTSDTFAKQGFKALCPDIYRGKLAQNMEEAHHLSSSLDWPGAIADISAASAWLKTQGCKKVGIMGFCMGGALTLATAIHDPTVDAGIVFYGICDLSKNDLSKVKCPIQGHFGALDFMKGFSAPEDGLNLETKGKELGLDIEVKIWPNAGHAFMNQDSNNFKQETAELALAEVVKFLRKNFQ